MESREYVLSALFVLTLAWPPGLRAEPHRTLPGRALSAPKASVPGARMLPRPGAGLPSRTAFHGSSLARGLFLGPIPDVLTREALLHTPVHVRGLAGGEGGIWGVHCDLEVGKDPAFLLWIRANARPTLRYCRWLRIRRTHVEGTKGAIFLDEFDILDEKPAPEVLPSPTPGQPPAGGEEEAAGTKAAGPFGGPDAPLPPPRPPEPPLTPPSRPEQAPPDPVRPTDEPPDAPPPDLPAWLKPWWEALKYVVPGSEFPAALPDGADALGIVIKILERSLREEHYKPGGGDERRIDQLEQAIEKLKKIQRRNSRER